MGVASNNLTLRGGTMNFDFGKDHPERKPDEVFLGNVDEQGFRACGWKSKRLGNIAYSIKGSPLGQTHPLFVLISEVNASK
jgi:hypothetical protein